MGPYPIKGFGTRRKEAKLNTTKRYYRVDRRYINRVRFVFEAYEGVAVVTTLDAGSGAIVLSIAPGCEDTAEAVMLDLGRHFMVEPRPAAPNCEIN
ncbi:MAG: DUF4911 domain-containing protein [Desulfobacteraceae bacterium]|nr:MAG: DUF4911 domain-containing protein [Desulfobacteraceae bacterium]